MPNKFIVLVVLFLACVQGPAYAGNCTSKTMAVQVVRPQGVPLKTQVMELALRVDPPLENLAEIEFSRDFYINLFVYFKVTRAEFEEQISKLTQDRQDLLPGLTILEAQGDLGPDEEAILASIVKASVGLAKMKQATYETSLEAREGLIAKYRKLLEFKDEVIESMKKFQECREGVTEVMKENQLRWVDCCNAQAELDEAKRLPLANDHSDDLEQIEEMIQIASDKNETQRLSMETNLEKVAELERSQRKIASVIKDKLAEVEQSILNWSKRND